MTIHTHTDITYQCDMCQKKSNKAPADVLNILNVQSLDSSIKLSLKINFSYEWVTDAIICNDCVIKYLKEFIKKQEQENGK
ncbi:hypothetical protein B6D08_02895 [Gilliamella apicola]|uniref:Uncharacterized protein n=1 Tax=Gilliamella apicola TaxID=1196095 RepID=A0A242NL87_9GAMM|nr:hypothetical protein B5S40_03745 [Gilliamella apicola]OTP84631.1 hypothetical protein B5S44_09410 [Gilliamella apicola]OTQ00790.1 hypothetical protein B6D08_02895 [Gilliamella apicola]OTQ11102.1 hypothetical protein B6C91_03510 [Gilliamella apicola]OTQ17619.1 hypothetical protein B6D11_02045 [Gilliamella apicola]